MTPRRIKEKPKMKEVTKLTPEECAERILSFKAPTVVMHARPDGDTVGTAAALLGCLKALGISARYACADPIPERLAFLVDGFERAEAPYTDEIITVDVASEGQLGDLKDAISPKLMIDHHEVSTPFAPYYSVPGASSAAEVLYGVIAELIKKSGLTLTREIAYPLYAAVSSDTGCFCYSNTAPSTYRLAATLIECGIDHAEINHRLFNSKSEKQLKAEGITAAKIKTAEGGRIAYAVITKADREESGIEAEHFETAIDIVRSLLGAEIAFVIKENDKGEYKVSLRSTGANVAEVARVFGGGGHIRAAGCTVDAKAAEEAKDKILSALAEMC